MSKQSTNTQRYQFNGRQCITGCVLLCVSGCGWWCVAMTTRCCHGCWRTGACGIARFGARFWAVSSGSGFHRRRETTVWSVLHLRQWTWLQTSTSSSSSSSAAASSSLDPLPSNRQHQSYGDCLEGKRGDYLTNSVLLCIVTVLWPCLA